MPAVSQDTLDLLRTQGYVLLPGLLPPVQVQGLRDCLRVARHEPEDRNTGTIKRHEVTYAMVTDPVAVRSLVHVTEDVRVRAVIEALHERPFVEHTKVLVKGAGSPETPWHQDDSYWYEFDPATTMLTVWVAIEDTTAQNGCLRIAPRSHELGLLAHRAVGNSGELEILPSVLAGVLERYPGCAVELAGGDGVMFLSRTVHSAHANRTDADRRAFKLVFQDEARRPARYKKHRTAFHVAGMTGLANRILPLAEVRARALMDKVELERASATGRRALRVLRSKGVQGSTRALMRRLSGRKTTALRSTLTDVFQNLRRFQDDGTDREWKQLLFYFEVMQRISGVPGDIAEFGVAGGISLLSFARILDYLEPGRDSKEKRKVIGFDSFAGLPDLSEKDRGPAVANAEMRPGGFRDPAGYQDLFRIAERHSNVVLVPGWFDQTVPEFFAKNPHTALALVHIDCDLYESTLCALKNCWDRIVPGGLVVFDELFHKDFPGETHAFREFFADKAIVLEKSRIKPDKKIVVKPHGGTAR